MERGGGGVRTEQWSKVVSTLLVVCYDLVKKTEIVGEYTHYTCRLLIQLVGVSVSVATSLDQLRPAKQLAHAHLSEHGVCPHYSPVHECPTPPPHPCPSLPGSPQCSSDEEGPLSSSLDQESPVCVCVCACVCVCV